MKIESKSFLKVLDNFGYPVDYSKEVVYFPRKIVEEYLEKAGENYQSLMEIIKRVEKQ